MSTRLTILVLVRPHVAPPDLMLTTARDADPQGKRGRWWWCQYQRAGPSISLREMANTLLRVVFVVTLATTLRASNANIFDVIVEGAYRRLQGVTEQISLRAKR